MSFTNHLEHALLDHVLGVASYPAPSLYVALGAAAPDESGSGLNEPVGQAYARVAHADWTSAAARSSANDGPVLFPQATGDWGTLTHFALFDAASGGNMLAYGTLDQPRHVYSGDQPFIPSGALQVSFAAGAFSDHLAEALLDHLLGVSAYTPPSIHVALSSSAVNDDGSGLSEPASGSYARVAHAAWSAASGGESANSGAVSFPQATASWGTISHLALLDASSAGNLLIHAALDRALPIDAGDTARFDDGSLLIALN